MESSAQSWLLIKPKAGLYIAAFQVIYLDYFKKIAVYYGEVSQITIIQVLIVSLLTITMVYGGIFARVAVGRAVLSRYEYLLFAAMVGLASIAFMVAFAETKSIASAGQVAVNLSIFAGLVIAMPKLLVDDDALVRFLRYVVVCIVPWSFMGLKQYFFGYSAMEWFYAETGLSQVASWQFFADISMYGFPRTIGFGSGSVNYGAVGLLLPLSLWLWWDASRYKLFWGFCSLMLFVGMIFSLQRFATILPFLGIGFFFFTKSWRRVIFAYATVLTLLGISIFASDFVRDRLDDLGAAIASDGRWAGTVLRVSTFGDRLNGWERLKDPGVYSLLGRFGDGTLQNYRGGGVGEYHDVINVILETFGVVGLLVVFGTMGYLGYRIHRIIFEIRDPHRQSLARILISAMVPIFVSGMVGGANFHANPFNFIMWMHIGAIYCLVRFDKEALPGSARLERDPSDDLYSPAYDDEAVLAAREWVRPSAGPARA